MSKYYNIQGKKVRVSDHEPNLWANGSSDIFFYEKDAAGKSISIGSQIDAYCDKHGLEISFFEPVIRDFAESDEECGYMLIEIEGGK